MLAYRLPKISTENNTELNPKDVAAVVRFNEYNLIFVIEIQRKAVIHHYREMVDSDSRLRCGIERLRVAVGLCDKLSSTETVLRITSRRENTRIVNRHADRLFNWLRSLN